MGHRTAATAPLLGITDTPVLERVAGFPRLRFMGSKYALLPWIHSVLKDLDFDSALDAFSGSGSVSYLLKAMGKRVVSNDFLTFCGAISTAIVENNHVRLDASDVELLTRADSDCAHFVESTFDGIFYTVEELRFLDHVAWNAKKLSNPYKRALAMSALVRACAKRQPRGVFTVAGDPERYKDGRRDLKLTLMDHFPEQVLAFNAAVFDNERRNTSRVGDVFELDLGEDLVYMDPPYVPRADDNCYIKRYHFLEGLVTYWEGQEILEDSRVKKLKKRFTPFSYRRTAFDAFERLFERFARANYLVLSYSSNGYPDLAQICDMLHKVKHHVEVHEHKHRYHFGTHAQVSETRACVDEYLIIGW